MKQDIIIKEYSEVIQTLNIPENFLITEFWNDNDLFIILLLEHDIILELNKVVLVPSLELCSTPSQILIYKNELKEKLNIPWDQFELEVALNEEKCLDFALNNQLDVRYQLKNNLGLIKVIIKEGNKNGSNN